MGSGLLIKVKRPMAQIPEEMVAKAKEVLSRLPQETVIMPNAASW